jgi:hypothetical protein
VNWPLPTSVEQFANVVVDGDGKLVRNVGLLVKNNMSPVLIVGESDESFLLVALVITLVL